MQTKVLNLAAAHFPRAKLRVTSGRKTAAVYVVGRCSILRVEALAKDIEQACECECEYDVERDDSGAVIWWTVKEVNS